MELSDIIPALIGTAFAVIYFLKRNQRRQYLREGILTQGTVIDLIEEAGRRGVMLYPVVRFTLKDGTWVTAKYSDGSNPSLFEKKEKVTLAYKEENPASFVIISNKVKQVEVIFLITGVILLGYSAYSLLLHYTG